MIDEFDERVLIGEIYLPLERLVAYYGTTDGSASAVQFRPARSALERARDRKLVDEYEAALPPGGWPNWVLGNHDRPRMAAGSGIDRRGRRHAAADACAARRPSTTAMRSACSRSRSRPISARSIRAQRPRTGPRSRRRRTPMQWDARRMPGSRPRSLAAALDVTPRERRQSGGPIRVRSFTLSTALIALQEADAGAGVRRLCAGRGRRRTAAVHGGRTRKARF